MGRRGCKASILPGADPGRADSNPVPTARLRALCLGLGSGKMSAMAAKPTWQIRPEQTGDEDGIDLVLRRAFGGANAANLVRTLRREGGYDQDLSLVAVEEAGGHRVVGHVLFSPIAIVHGDAPSPAMALGPLAVSPDRQRKGVGAALVQAGLEACRARGLAIVLVLGDPAYYSRFGFVHAGDAHIEPPHANWARAYQVVELLPGALRETSGVARYPSAWDDV